ncbi:hypothetical protein ACS0TY_026238 [Phlomoides rotata]
MGFRRSVTARAELLYQQLQRYPRRLSPLIHRRDNDDENRPRNRPIPNSPAHFPNYNFLRPTGINYLRSRSLFQHHNEFAAFSPVFVRNMSSLGDKSEIMTDVADVVSPVVNEVAVAAADSFFPVAAVQHLIDYVHIYTGFNWWASIVLTTVLIRTFQLPLMIHQLKATSQFTLLRPRLEEIKEEMSREMNPISMAEGRTRMKELFKEYGVTPFTPLKGVFIVGPVFFCFFLGITNMAEKVQSFNKGGTLWFIDLATPDPLYILPILTALSFWITVECNAQEGMQGNPAYGTIKNVSRAFAALLIPLTVTFPKALFCYWITSNLYSLAYGLVIKNPQVKKMLGVPIIPVSPPSTDNKKPSVSFIEELKKHAATAQQKQSASSPPADVPANHQKLSSSSILSQRIKSLEKEVKGRKVIKN